MRKTKNILIAPLNWGLGHATRCIPIIKKLQVDGHRIIIASDGAALKLLQKEIDGAIFEKLPAYNITYAKNPRFNKWHLLNQLPRLFKIIKQENKITNKLIQKHHIDLLISDNRFGVYSPDIKSVYITHQLRVLSGWTSFITTWIHRRIYQKYDEIWVPDNVDQPNLSGKLGHLSHTKLNIKYIGIQSRMTPKSYPKKYDVLAVLSGPEPQRSLLEKKLIKELGHLKTKSAIIQGIVGDKKTVAFKENLTVYNYVTSNELETLINSSEIIISRSGYTSIMDLVSLQKKVLWIPTPGQAEQVYLAGYLSKKYGCKTQKQNKINLNDEYLKNLWPTENILNQNNQEFFNDI